MKITTNEIRIIIKEELKKILSEQGNERQIEQWEEWRLNFLNQHSDKVGLAGKILQGLDPQVRGGHMSYKDARMAAQSRIGHGSVADFEESKMFKQGLENFGRDMLVYLIGKPEFLKTAANNPDYFKNLSKEMKGAKKYSAIFSRMRKEAHQGIDIDGDLAEAICNHFGGEVDYASEKRNDCVIDSFPQGQLEIRDDGTVKWTQTKKHDNQEADYVTETYGKVVFIWDKNKKEWIKRILEDTIEGNKR